MNLDYESTISDVRLCSDKRLILCLGRVYVSFLTDFLFFFLGGLVFQLNFSEGNTLFVTYIFVKSVTLINSFDKNNQTIF